VVATALDGQQALTDPLNGSRVDLLAPVAPGDQQRFETAGDLRVRLQRVEGIGRADGDHDDLEFVGQEFE
jgi:hypothetical protein